MQEVQQQLHSFLRPRTCAFALCLSSTRKLLHGAGEELSPPVPRWALTGWRPQLVMAEWHRLLHMGRGCLWRR
uniref:Uncharacterized protein n=1 Tax=Arundo donax TaxID=35708 RepID=A0A0A9V2U9_ARUDO